MDNKKYGLYKRIMKHDQKAIDEIESLEEAKEIIRMVTGNIYLNGEIYQMEQELVHKFMIGDKEVIDNIIDKFTSNRTSDVNPDIDI